MPNAHVAPDIQLIPTEALAYMASKKLKTSYHWYEIYAQEHQHAFTVAKIMETDVLNDIHQAIIQAIEKGETLKHFQDNLLERLGESGWGNYEQLDEQTGERITRLSDRRLKKIYFVNKTQARHKGAWARIEATKADFPYLRYRLGASKVHRDAHLRFKDLVLKVDDPFWNTHMPMNGWGCKCWVEQLTEAQAQAQGISDSPHIEYHDWQNPTTGEIHKIPKGISPGFEYNVGKSQAPHDSELVGTRILQTEPLSPQRALRLLKVLSKGNINDVKSPHFTYGYQVLENIVKHNPSVSVRELQKTYGTGLVWQVATLNPKLQKLLGAETRAVWLSEQTLIKQIKKHQREGIDRLSYEKINEIINNPDEFVFESDLHTVFFKKGHSWYKVALKLTGNRKELYVTSFHFVQPEQVERRLK